MVVKSSAWFSGYIIYFTKYCVKNTQEYVRGAAKLLTFYKKAVIVISEGRENIV